MKIFLLIMGSVTVLSGSAIADDCIAGHRSSNQAATCAGAIEGRAKVAATEDKRASSTARYVMLVRKIEAWPASRLKTLMIAEISCMVRLHPELLERALETSCLMLESDEVATFKAVNHWDPTETEEQRMVEQKRAELGERKEREQRPSVRIGMKADDVIKRSSWCARFGSESTFVHRVNRTETAAGIDEQWICNDGTSSPQLHLHNDVVTMIKN